MFILKITVTSNDGAYSINALSNNIQIVSPNISTNSYYFNNLQLEFNGTFVEADIPIYIATIYNYFLTAYNVELIGPIQCFQGILFVSGVDGSNATIQAILANGTLL